MTNESKLFEFETTFNLEDWFKQSREETLEFVIEVSKEIYIIFDNFIKEKIHQWGRDSLIVNNLNETQTLSKYLNFLIGSNNKDSLQKSKIRINSGFSEHQLTISNKKSVFSNSEIYLFPLIFTIKNIVETELNKNLKINDYSITITMQIDYDLNNENSPFFLTGDVYLVPQTTNNENQTTPQDSTG